MTHSTTAARLILRLGVSAVLALGMASCGGDGGTAPLEPTAQLIAQSPQEQAGTVGTQPGALPSVRALDSRGRPISRRAIVFTITAGEGTLASSNATTDENGVATLHGWQLGTTAGLNRVRAQDGGGGPSVSFSVQAEAGEAAVLALAVAPRTLYPTGSPLTTPPVIEIHDAYGNVVAASTSPVTAAVAEGQVTFDGALTVHAVAGRATFSGLIPRAAGELALRFTSPGLQPVSTPRFIVPAERLCAGAAFPLDMELGGTVRFSTGGGDAPRCLIFDASAHTGREYLLMFENLPIRGGYEEALFRSSANDASSMVVTVRDLTAAPAASPLRVATPATPALPHGTGHAWDFGAGPIYEAVPEEPAGGVAPATLLRRGERIAVNATGANPVAGDTVLVRIENHTGPEGVYAEQRAVVRHVSEHLIIAEDVRLPTLQRSTGGTNTPLTQMIMDSIAQQYSAYGARQLDLLFENRHNAMVELRTPRRYVAVHSLMRKAGTWGYTFSSGDFFIFDYWVGTDGSTRGLAQHPQRVADNLFTHEIAHMRHWGLQERANRATQTLRGNRWLVEGFAAFTERLPIAMRLLNQPAVVRTGNVVLPYNSAFGNQYYFADVAGYLLRGALFNGYDNSSYIFDWIADQAANDGRDWMAAVRDVVIHAGVPSDLDAAVGRSLPGLDYGQAMTRARIALYLDDIGTFGLPAWTQYHQYRLRQSRPPGNLAANDPRTLWARVVPGEGFTREITVGSGAVTGLVIDGRTPIGSALIDLAATAAHNVVYSVTRIR